MRTIPIHVDAAKLGAINLGKQGESLACRVRFYASKWHEDYPEAEYQLFVSPPGATPYLADITQENGVVTWELTENDTTIPGSGSIELILTDGETKIKSVTYRTTLDKSPSSQEPGGAPDVHPTWWEGAIKKIEAATTAAIDEIDGAFEDEKQEATAAIVKAAEGAIASIPADYTELAGEVSSLKDATANLINGTPNTETLSCKPGLVHEAGYNIENPKTSTSARKTCFASVYIPTGKGYSVEFDSSVYTVAAAFFNEEKECVSVVGFFDITPPYVLPKNAQNSPYVVVEFRRKDGATITADEAASLGATLNYPVYPGTRRLIVLSEDMHEQLTVTQDCDIIGNGHEINLGVELDDGSNSGVFTVAYEAAAGSCTDRVFVTKDLEVENTTVSRPYYYVTLWSIAEDTANDKILTPLMTEEEVSATPDSFTYNGTAFIINSTGHKRIVMAQDYEVDGSGEKRYGLYINGAYNVNVYNAKFNFAGMYGARIGNGASVNFYNCEFGYAKTDSGLYAIDSVVNCFGCIANHNGNDGFNYHNTGNGLAVECCGSYNADDGISNHDSFDLRINGGRFVGNGKGGVACPTYGAACDIANVYCAGNQVGIYAFHDTETGKNVIVNGALLKDNEYPFHIKNYDVIAVNVKKVNNTNADLIKSGTLTEY